MLQSESPLWFKHRKGRITASRFGAVCRTSVNSPSVSLLQSILQTKPLLRAPAVQWGRDNEQIAREAYISINEARHTKLTLTVIGLHVHPDYPHLGASSDGLASYSCYGKGLLEIKCPFGKQHIDPTQVLDHTFYLKHSSVGLWLSKTRTQVLLLGPRSASNL